MTDIIRAFVGIKIKPLLRRRLVDAAKASTEALGNSRIRWVKPENLHLTLLFLGNQHADHLTTLADLLADNLSHLAPFHITLDKLGGFPAANAKILAARAAQCETLDELHEKCKELSAFMDPTDNKKTFKPHITLARFNKPLPVKERSLSLAISVDSISIFRSETGAEGPLYTTFAEVALDGQTGLDVT